MVFFLRSYLLWKNTHVYAVTFDKEDDTHGYNGRVFIFISILELFVISIYAFLPSWHQYLLPFWYLQNDIVVKLGWLILIVSLPLVWIAQSHMHKSWRIGIDEINPAELVTTGLFKYSRNPIFLGIMLTNIGLFMVLPNAFTILIVSLSTVCINTQIRLEEAFLMKTYREDYIDYKKVVRRWI